MNSLDKYVEDKKTEIRKLNISDELDVIKYIYIDLGKRISFDSEFLPFGNSKTKQLIYKCNGNNIKDLERCMNSKTAICKSLSYILEYVLKRFDVDIETIVDPLDNRKCPHVFNTIKLKDDRKFCVDLQEDINNIQTHSFTSRFGLENIYTSKLLIDRKSQEEIDRRINYLSKDECYSDDYLYLLHLVADSIEDFREKARFVLENIDIIPTKKMGYIDRQWHHKKILEELFTKKEFEYDNNSGKIKMFDCYKDVNGKRKCFNFITVNHGHDTDIYVYNVKESKFCEIDKEHWFNCVINGINIKGNIGRQLQKIYGSKN